MMRPIEKGGMAIVNIHLYSDKQPAAVSFVKGTKRTQGMRFIIARYDGNID
jgi:hypothetical protein